MGQKVIKLNRMIIKSELNMREVILSCFLLFSFIAYGQWQPVMKLRPGINSFSYLTDGTAFLSGPPQFEYFINTQITTPVLGLDLNWPQYRLSVIGSYYMAFITHPSRPPYNFEINDVKSAGAVDVVYNWDSFRLGLILTTRDYRRLAIYSGGNFSENIQRGVGISFGFPWRGFEIEIRKELIWAANNKYNNWAGGNLLYPGDAWNLRLSYPIEMYSNKSEPSETPVKNKFSQKSGFSVHGGISLTGNPNYDITLQTSRSTLPVTYGLEYFMKPLKLSLFYRRAQSLKINVFHGVLNEYIQNNYLGVAHWVEISENRYLKVELNHNWAFNRLAQTMVNEDLVNSGANDSEYLSFGAYDNLSIGLGVRYPINSYMDVFSNFDFYYKANSMSSKGYAPNSLSVGLMFHFQPK